MRDDFRILPKDTDVSVGQDTILKCSPPKGHPSPEVRWKKDGDFLDLTSSNRYKLFTTLMADLYQDINRVYFLDRNLPSLKVNDCTLSHKHIPTY